MLGFLLLSNGCALLSRTIPEPSPKERPESAKSKDSREAPHSQPEKAVEPTSVPTRDREQNQPKETRAQSVAGTSAHAKKSKHMDEEQQVKAAVRELAKSLEAIAKIKVCYVTKDDEWWATFYEDIGPVIEVKPFIWNRESEKFEPYLVLKRISKSKFETDLKRDDPGQKCDILSPPEKENPEKSKPEKPK